MADEEKKEQPKPAAKPAAKADGGKKSEGGERAKPVKVRMRERYQADIVPKLMQKLQVKNKMAVPKLTKICLNVGFGKAATENLPKLMEQCLSDITAISGQKAVVTKSKKSISNFKLRQGMQVGCRVTLRGTVMWEFFDRLVNVAIPRIRDFRGVSPRSFDGRGNYSLGLQEQTVFPEIDSDKVEFVHGMDITICTTARNNQQAFELLKEMGMPFRER
ncbi:MAG: 50S ribosomal protein L5 [Planctomycetota bacterium]|nr:50S ribosomal protein L5 [Planctomycetota bacterium]